MRRYFWPKRFKNTKCKYCTEKEIGFFLRLPTEIIFFDSSINILTCQQGKIFTRQLNHENIFYTFLNPSLIFRFQPTPKVADSYTIKAFTPVAHGYHFLKYWNHSIGEEVCTCYYSSKKKNWEGLSLVTIVYTICVRIVIHNSNRLQGIMRVSSLWNPRVQINFDVFVAVVKWL